MPNNIDQKVVQMQFDNKQFEKGVAESLKSLELLKKGLELDKSADSLHKLEQVANTIDFSGLKHSIDSIGDHFTVVGRFIDRHIDQLIDKAVHGVQSFVKSITTDQISKGMGKYEQYNKAVQMIRSALPEESMETIEGTLEKLNEYTDLTSYDFAQMAQTIGKFTSKGIGLKDAEMAMEGIANWSAAAGGEIQQANIAMYNLSQALGAGAVKKIDWKSIENANMDTKEFKEQVIDTAIALGVLGDAGNHTGIMVKQTSKGVKQITVDYQNFAETLSEGWFNSDVLMETLKEYADRESTVGEKGFLAAKEAITLTQAIDAIKDAVSTSWMHTFKLLIGDLDEATYVLTKASDAVIDFLDGFDSARNELLAGWHGEGLTDDMSGYTMALQSISNLWEVFTDIVYTAKEALESVFPPATSETLINMTGQVLDFTQNLKEMIGITRETETTQVAVPIRGTEEFKEFATSFKDVIKYGARSEDVARMQQNLMNLGISVGESGADGIFGPNTLKALKAFEDSVGLATDGVYDLETHTALLNKVFGEANTEFQDVESTVETVSPGLQNIRNILQGLFSIIHMGVSVVKTAFTAVTMVIDTLSPLGAALMTILGVIGKCFTALDNGVSILNPLNAALFILEQILTPVKFAFETINNAVTAFFENNHIEDFITLFFALGEAIKNSPIGEWVMQSFGNAIKPIAEFVSNIVTTASIFINTIKQMFARPSKNLKTFWDRWNNIVGHLILSGNKMAMSIGSFMLKIQATFQKIIPTIVAFATRIKEAIGPTVITALTIIGGLIGGVAFGLFQLGKAVVGAVVAVADFIKNNQVIQSIFQKIIDIGGAVRSVFAKLGEAIRYAFNTKFTFKFQVYWDKFVKSIKGGKSKAIRKIGEFLENFGKRIGEAIPKIRQFGENFKNWFGDKFQKISTWITDNVPKALQSIKDFFVGAYNSVKNSHFIQNGILGIKDAIAKVAPGISNFVKNAGKAIHDFFVGENGDEKFDILKKLEQLRDKVGNLIQQIRDVIAAKFQELYDTSPLFKSFVDKIQPIIDKITGAFGFFGSQISAFFTMDTSDKEGFFEKLQKRLTAFKPLVMQFTIMKDKLVQGFKDLLGIKEDGSFDFFDAIGNIGAKIGEFFGNLKGIPFDKVLGLAGKALGAYAIFSLFKTARNMSGMLKKFGQSIFLKSGGKMDTLGDTALKIGGAIAMVAVALGLLSKADSKQLLANTAILVGVFAAVATIGSLAKTFGGKDVGKSIMSMGVGILALVAAVGLMMTLTTIAPGKVAGALGIIAVMLLGLAGIEILISRNAGLAPGMGMNQVLGMCIGVGILVAALAGAVAIVANNDAKTIIGGMAMVLTLLGSLAGIEIAISKLSGDKNIGIGPILSMAIGLALVVHSLNKVVKLVRKNKQSTIDKAMTIVIGIIVALGGAATVIGATNKDIMSGFGTLLGSGSMLVVAHAVDMIVGTFADALEQIKDVDPTLMNDFFRDVGIAFVALIGTIELLGHTVGPSLIGSGVLVVVGAAIDAFSDFVNNSLDKLSSAVWIVTSKLGDATTNAEDINFDIIPKIVDATKDMVDMIGITADVDSTDADDFSNAIQNLGSAIEQFDGMVANFEPSDYVKDGVFEQAVTNLCALLGSEQLTSIDPQATSGFINAFQGLGGALSNAYTSVKDIPDGAFASMTSLINDSVGAIDLVNSKFKGLATQSAILNMQKFAGGVHLYYRNLKDIDTSTGATPEQIKTAFMGLADAMPDDADISRIASYATGEDKGAQLIDFADGLVNLGAAIESYGENIGKLNAGKVFLANLVLNAVSGLTTSLSGGEGNFITLSSNVNDTTTINVLSSAANGIEQLGSALSTYGEKIGTLDSDKVKSANEVIDKVAGLPDVLNDNTPFTRFMNWISGNNQTISTFSNDINKIANALGNYGTKIGTLKDTEIEQANKVLTEVSGLEIEATGGLMGLIMGNSSLGNFASNFGTLGKGIADFAAQVKDSEIENINMYKALAPIKALGSVQGDMKKTGGLLGLLVGNSEVTSIGEAYENFGKSLAKFSDDADQGIGKLDATKIELVTDTLAKVVDEMVKIKDVSNFDMLTDVGRGFYGFFGNMNNINNEWITQSTEKFALIGEYMAKGLVQGLNDNSALVTEAIRAVMSDTDAAARDEVEVESPSKKFEEIGMYLIQGLVNGINKYKKQVEDAAGDITSTAAEAVEKNDTKEAGHTLAGEFAAGLDKYSFLVVKAWRSIKSLSLAAIYEHPGFFKIAGQVLLQKLLEGFKEYSKDFKDNIGKILTGGKDSVASGGSGFYSSGGNLANNLKKGIISKLNSFGSAFTNAVKNVANFIKNAGVVPFQNTGKSMTEKIKEGISNGLTTVATAITSISKYAGKKLMNEDGSYTELGEELANKLARGVINGIKYVGVAAQKLAKSGHTTISDKKGDYQDTGKTLIDYLITGVKDGGLRTQMLTALANLSKSSSESAANQKTSYQTTGQTLLQYLYTGVSDGSRQNNIKNTLANLSKAGAKSVSNEQNSYLTAAWDLLYKLRDGVADKNLRSQIKDTAATTASKGAEGVKGVKEQFKWAGWALLEGLQKGLKDSNAINNIVNAAINVASAAYNAAKKWLNINSPSRKFIALGNSMDEGLVVGIEEYANSVANSGENVAQSAVDGAIEGLHGFSSLVLDNVNDDFVIRPVLDLSDVESGLGGMNSMFGSQTIGVRSTALAGRISSMSNAAALQTSIDNGLSNSSLAASIDALNTRIDDLGARISNMRVVTETGALVGQIASGVDRVLGKRQYMSARGG